METEEIPPHTPSRTAPSRLRLRARVRVRVEVRVRVRVRVMVRVKVRVRVRVRVRVIVPLRAMWESGDVMPSTKKKFSSLAKSGSPAVVRILILSRVRVR